MSTIIVPDDDVISKKPGAIKVYPFDWSTKNLAPGVVITSSIWAITPVYPSTTDSALTKDQESILAGTRTTQVRLAGGTLGQAYDVTNTIVTNETPTQTKVGRVRVVIE